MGISAADRKLLWGKSRNQCAYLSCLQPVTQPLPGPHGTEIVVGEEAHIRSKSPDGPRYDPDYDPALLDSSENFIVLCPTHHAMVDKDDGSGYTAEQLVKMRRDHEQQLEKSERLESTILAYLGHQYEADDRVRFEAVDINGLALESLFVDVPMARRVDAPQGDFIAELQREHPGDLASLHLPPEFAAAGAAQALLHPDWYGNAVLVGGPGQGKSTLLQFLCQFHRARLLQRIHYTGAAQRLEPITTTHRIPIRLDLKAYASWSRPRSGRGTNPAKRKDRSGRQQSTTGYRSLEQYIAHHISEHSGGTRFRVEDLATVLSTRPVLLALDGLDEVANLADRERVADAIAETGARLAATAGDLVILVASRPGATSGRLWSSSAFPTFTIQRLTTGLRLQYLQAWAQQAGLDKSRADRLQAILLEHETVPHIRELASNPMQLAILLHLLHRRQLLPQQRTELYDSYVETFFDREDDKEPLVQTERKIVEDIHAYLGWHLQCQTELGRTAGSISREQLRALLDDYLRDHDEGRELADRLFHAFTARVICLVATESDDIEFEVQSLREYFAARFIVDHAPVRGAGNARDDCINALLERPYWSNVLRFLVGMLSKGEIRAIPSNLRTLQQQRGMKDLPLSRGIAAQLLDDRVFGALGSGPIQEMVALALEGPGVVLGEDGLLDASGTPLALSEGAGRAQALRHLQDRLLRETDPVLRTVIAGALTRHADTVDLKAWWWSDQARQVSATWLRTTAELGALGDLTAAEAEHIAACASTMEKSGETVTPLLLRGGCDCHLDILLRRCLTELGDGIAATLPTAADDSPIGQMIHAARSASDPSGGGTAATQTRQPTRRRRIRSRAGSELLGKINAATTGPLASTNDWSHADTWVGTLDEINRIWGDSWLLRQAVFNLPNSVKLAPTDADNSAGAAWRQQAAWLRRAVEHRADPAWWQGQLPAEPTRLPARSWAFALLAHAQHAVVLAAAADLDRLLDAMKPHHLTALDAGLTQHVNSGGRRLSLHDQLRLGKVSFHGRAAALLNVVAFESSREQLAKCIDRDLPELLRDGLAGLTALRVPGNATTIKAEQLRGTRPHRLDSILEVARLTGLTDSQSRHVLSTPHEWPTTVVQAAAQRLSQKTAEARDALAVVAENANWFPDVNWRPRR